MVLSGLQPATGYAASMVTNLKSSSRTSIHPGALSSNEHSCHTRRLPAPIMDSTSYGLNMLDKKSGKIQKEFGALNNERVQSILITKDNTI